MDQITLDRIQTLHPRVRQEVDNIYRNQIVPALSGTATCRFAYTLRTFAEQNAIYAQGRTRLFDANGNRLGIVTKAKGGQSIHNYGLALDIVLINNRQASWQTNIDFDKDGRADWMEVVNIFKANGWEWGGDWKFKDRPHFQKALGYDWRTLLQKWNSGDTFIDTNGIKYVNL